MEERETYVEAGYDNGGVTRKLRAVARGDHSFGLFLNIINYRLGGHSRIGLPFDKSTGGWS